MNDSKLKNEGGDSFESVYEGFLDPHEEVFIGPITEREKELRKNLPRRTLHLTEVVELTQRGLSYQEWEEYKEQQQRKELDNSTMNPVFDGDHDSTVESFDSCCNSENVQDHIQDGKLEAGVFNDTWEMQEQMLAMAERLERGEDVPELGICHNTEKNAEQLANELVEISTASSQSNDVAPEELAREVEEISMEAFQVKEIESEGNFQVAELTKAIGDSFTFSDNPKESFQMDNNVLTSPSLPPLLAELGPKDCNSFHRKSLVNEGSCSSSTQKHTMASLADSSTADILILGTPGRTPQSAQLSSSRKNRFISPAPTSLDKIQSIPIKNTSPGIGIERHREAASPVAMYIRGGVEPILIENVRSVKKKLLNNNPISHQKIAVRNAHGRWSTGISSPSINHKEGIPGRCDLNVKPVLPVVLHEAAVSMVTEDPNQRLPSVPWSKSKIAKLLERNPTPTVLKHQGRIQMMKSEATSTPKSCSRSTYKLGTMDRPDNSLIDVSVLQEVERNIEPSSLRDPRATPKSHIPVRRYQPFSK